jgi:mannose-1-phosphate guanylyltransferase
VHFSGDNWGQTTFFARGNTKALDAHLLITLFSFESVGTRYLERLEGLDANPPVIVCNEEQRFMAAEQMWRMGLEDQVSLKPAKRPWKMAHRTCTLSGWTRKPF